MRAYVCLFLFTDLATWQHVSVCNNSPDVYYFIGDLATRVRLIILISRPGNMCLCSYNFS
jgi:hypothetical protein